MELHLLVVSLPPEPESATDPDHDLHLELDMDFNLELDTSAPTRPYVMPSNDPQGRVKQDPELIIFSRYLRNISTM